MLSVDDIRGLYAITQTPSLGNVTDYDADNTVDLTALEALLNRLIDDKVQGIILFGTTGEMATLTPQECGRVHGCQLGIPSMVPSAPRSFA